MPPNLDQAQPSQWLGHVLCAFASRPDGLNKHTLTSWFTGLSRSPALGEATNCVLGTLSECAAYAFDALLKRRFIEKVSEASDRCVLSQSGWLCLSGFLNHHVGALAAAFIKNAKATPMSKEELEMAEKDGGPCTPLKPGDISLWPIDISIGDE